MRACVCTRGDKSRECFVTIFVRLNALDYARTRSLLCAHGSSVSRVLRDRLPHTAVWKPDRIDTASACAAAVVRHRGPPRAGLENHMCVTLAASATGLIVAAQNTHTRKCTQCSIQCVRLHQFPVARAERTHFIVSNVDHAHAIRHLALWASSLVRMCKPNQV